MNNGTTHSGGHVSREQCRRRIRLGARVLADGILLGAAAADGLDSFPLPLALTAAGVLLGIVADDWWWWMSPGDSRRTKRPDSTATGECAADETDEDEREGERRRG